MALGERGFGGQSHVLKAEGEDLNPAEEPREPFDKPRHVGKYKGQLQWRSKRLRRLAKQRRKRLRCRQQCFGRGGLSDA